MLNKINIVTVIIAVIVALYFIKGLRNKFSGQSLYYSITGLINMVLLFISLFLSVGVTKDLFVNKGDGQLYKIIYDAIPGSIKSFIDSSGVLIYIAVVPFLMITIFFLLSYLRSLLDNPIKRVSYFLCDNIRNTNIIFRWVTGVTVEIPRALVTIISVVLIISLLGAYFPSNPITSYAMQSKLYNNIYNNSVYRLMGSSIGKKIPVFLQYSIDEFSKGIDDYKTLSGSGVFQSIGLIRFRYESRSNEKIDSMAKKIVENEKDERKKAYLLYKWVGNNISYDWEKYNNIVNKISSSDKFGAVPAFETRKGICEDYADLYSAMARAVGLKVRIVVGQGYSMNSWGGHAWNEVYIPKENRWIPVDPTWARTGDYFDNRDFYKTHKIEAVAAEW